MTRWELGASLPDGVIFPIYSADSVKHVEMLLENQENYKLVVSCFFFINVYKWELSLMQRSKGL